MIEGSDEIERPVIAPVHNPSPDTDVDETIGQLTSPISGTNHLGQELGESHGMVARCVDQTQLAIESKPAAGLFDLLEPVAELLTAVVGTPGLDVGAHRFEVDVDHDPLLAGCGAAWAEAGAAEAEPPDDRFTKTVRTSG